MIVGRTSALAGLFGFLCLGGVALADPPEAESYLADRGLTKLSSYFALADEANLNKALRDADDLKKAIADAQRKIATAEKVVEAKKKLILTYLEQRSQLRARLAQNLPPTQHNQAVLMLQELADRVTALQQSTKEEEALREVQTAESAATEKYIEHLMRTRKLFDQVVEQYADLAADPRVQDAIDQFNKQSQIAYKLGPGTAFLSAERRLKKMEDTVLSEAIPLRKGMGNLWMVSTMFSGKYPQELCVDTGASICCLPFKTAASVGVRPTEDAQKITLTLADGRTVEAQLVAVDSIRVGKFTVEKVDVAVMPESLTEAAPLLGQSFLKHFTYKIDPANEQLIMSKVEAKD